MLGKLFLVSTPIGNLRDMTLRAIETLKAVDIVACEDTRHTGKLLKAFNISNKLISYHDRNENDRADELAQMLTNGRSIAVVSDAGTPGINDPGYRIVLKAIEVGAEISAIPGACAFVAAVAVSGLPTDSIFFGGFLPSRKGERRKRLFTLKEISSTLVFYESPHRLIGSLGDCLDVLGDRKAVLARELTKLHEEIIRGQLSELCRQAVPPRGEYVLLIDRPDGTEMLSDGGNLSATVSKFEDEGYDRKTALKRAAKVHGLTRSEAYRRFNDL